LETFGATEVADETGAEEPFTTGAGLAGAAPPTNETGLLPGRAETVPVTLSGITF